jgi:oxalate decarboxylase/phosphoglucose isomerase-like protein (cupin superfamily)
MIENRGIDNLSMANSIASPSNKTISIIQQRQKQHEGLYQDEEGKNIDYKDRIRD